MPDQEIELLSCQKALMLLFQVLPVSSGGMAGIFLKAFRAQQGTMLKALQKDPKLQLELDSLFTRTRDELVKIYPLELK